MAVPHISANFADLLDPIFQRILNNRFNDLASKRERLFNMEPFGQRGDTTKWSSVSSLTDWDDFTGTVDYTSQDQGYDTTATHKEFTKGVQVERKLFDDDRWNVMNARPRAMADSAFRTREGHAAQPFNNAFSVDTEFYVNTEAVALCSNSHTTTTGASTANGFDNLNTGALTAAAVETARIQMVQFRGDQAERITVQPNELLFHPSNYGRAHEIVMSQGRPGTADNDDNVHTGSYALIEWNYLTDANNWFMMDSSMRQLMLHWVDRIAMEFAMIEDFDTLIAKWRGYMRYSFAWIDWRWVLGHQVS